MMLLWVGVDEPPGNARALKGKIILQLAYHFRSSKAVPRKTTEHTTLQFRAPIWQEPDHFQRMVQYHYNNL